MSEILLTATGAFFAGYLLGFFQSIKVGAPAAEVDPRDG